jgi:hypothetical protein
MFRYKPISGSDAHDPVLSDPDLESTCPAPYPDLDQARRDEQLGMELKEVSLQEV